MTAVFATKVEHVADDRFSVALRYGTKSWSVVRTKGQFWELHTQLLLKKASETQLPELKLPKKSVCSKPKPADFAAAYLNYLNGVLSVVQPDRNTYLAVFLDSSRFVAVSEVTNPLRAPASAGGVIATRTATATAAATATGAAAPTLAAGGSGPVPVAAPSSASPGSAESLTGAPLLPSPAGADLNTPPSDRNELDRLTRERERAAQERRAAEERALAEFRAAEETARREAAAAAASRRRALYTAGAVFIKHGRRGKPHPREVFVTDDGRAVGWCEPRTPRMKAELLPLSELRSVQAGMTTAVFERVARQRDELEPLCFSLVFRDRTLDLQAGSRADRELWLRRFMDLLAVLRAGTPLW